MSDKPHDNWAEIYDEVYTTTFGCSYNMITRIALEIIQEKTGFGAEILDIGAGTGRLSIPLLERGFSVSAVDSSTKMLDVLKRKDDDGAIRTINCLVQELDLNQTFDTVICVFSVFCYLTREEDLKAAIKTIVRHTSDTGYALIDIPNIASFSDFSYESERLMRQVHVTGLDPEEGLFEYSENILIAHGENETFYEDNFHIRYWDPETLLGEFEKAGMNVLEDVTDRLRGAGADYFILGKP
tara:strand:- start:970 stop:1692 length:723 start_codon:yes stop_codon:yes gene_type:complete